ncbi:MAG TPA: HAD-IA family hydrolase [Thermogutta sp.]|nr:HAD-IA family hydrolase [Thermogutta sp.]
MKVFVFDLDDTLYLERDYVFSGFQSVARKIEEKSGLSSELVYEELIQDFNNGLRAKNFDRLLEKNPEIQKVLSLEEIIHYYRSHFPRIRLLQNAEHVLKCLKKEGYFLGLITDGYLKTQKLKVESLKITSFFDKIVFTDQWGKAYWKPHERAFYEIERAWRVKGQDLVYIGDNPEKDFFPAKKRFWKTIRLRIPGQLHYTDEPKSKEDAPDEECRSFTELEKILFK